MVAVAVAPVEAAMEAMVVDMVVVVAKAVMAAAPTAATQVVVVATPEVHLEEAKAVALDMAGVVADMVEADTALAVATNKHLKEATPPQGVIAKAIKYAS